VLITDKGLELLKQIDGESKKWNQEYKTLNPDEAKKLNFLLDKIRG
jgi:hypothetical protein